MHEHARIDRIDEAAIVRLIDAFYARVRRDPVLAPVFEQAIPEAEWPAHLQTMYAFWSAVMLTSGRYKGDPVTTHRAVQGVAPEMFGRWLDLFEATADDLCTPALADLFADKARRIGESLKLALFFRPGKPWTEDLRNRPKLAGRGDGVPCG